MKRPFFPGLPQARLHQRGAATLLVVMLLFFVVSLVAAYAGRTMLFEQRTSANQYRYSQGFEVAESGIDWALIMLASGRVDASCTPTTDTTKPTFYQRYLTVNTGTDPTKFGNVYPVMRSDDTTSLWAACLYNGTNWACSCPTDSTPDLTPPTAPGMYPGFGVRFVRLGATATSEPYAASLVRIEVNGCANYSLECATAVRFARFGFESCSTSNCAVLALASSAKMPPLSTITARGSVSGTMKVTRTDTKSGGVTIHAGSLIDITGMTLITTAGTPPELSISGNDTTLASLPIDSAECKYCLFASTFGLWPKSFRNQPAMVEIDCTATCDAAAVNTAVQQNPQRPLWLKGAGGLTITGSTNIGSLGAPVVLVVEGPIVLNAPSARVHGLVYGFTDVSLLSGGLSGALISAGNVTGGGTADLVYDPGVLGLARVTIGSFVKVPGSWRDFP